MQSVATILRRCHFRYLRARDTYFREVLFSFSNSLHSPPYYSNLSRLRPFKPVGVSLPTNLCSKSGLTNNEVKRKIEEISDNFREALELLNDARDSLGTVYFTEDMNEAETAILSVITDYENLLIALNDEQKRNVIRTIGLKMEELKSQAQMVKEAMKE